ncbi:MAG TPA: HlyD family efflux transporter periplasmic adaptor subunit [Terracidiphilus sp.]|nr:HlyD family efflux transporter periplasmic adaptor subunit [Terracidiphilus sp.]
MAEERKQSGRLWLWLGAAVLTVLVFFVARALTRERLTVRAVRVSHQQLVNTISTNGRVEPVVNYPLYSPIASTVKAIYVQQGDKVAAGKLLLEVDDVQARAHVASAESGVQTAHAALDAANRNGTLQERQAAAAEINRARIDRDQARHDLDALARLKSTGAASASEVAAAQERLDTAEAGLHAAEDSARNRYAPPDVARAQAALADAEAGLTAARDVLAKTAPNAPVAGTVYSVNVGRSEFAEEGRLLLQLADLRSLRVRAYFDEPLIGQLAVGESVQIKWDGDSHPGHVWLGHVVRTPTTVVQYTTRTVGETLIEIDGGDGGLLPDTNVTVTVTTSSLPDALTVPREALHVENGKPYVFKVVGDELVRTPVTVGTPNLTLAPILSGLGEGDIVATGSTSGLPLQESIPVKVLR